ncbi:hypothetical protein BB558_000840 [Smittium angustum]|uniref:Beta-catenin-like protein 1 N-terminal domain-containing protein n=1 Tax=Smittium angustum TaxID=133377 RepID=A0A2U1JDF6_SMIAN|nr:hypothetical protein BB558_000840 [Smittium angustum]
MDRQKSYTYFEGEAPSTNFDPEGRLTPLTTFNLDLPFDSHTAAGPSNFDSNTFQSYRNLRGLEKQNSDAPATISYNLQAQEYDLKELQSLFAQKHTPIHKPPSSINLNNQGTLNEKVSSSKSDTPQNKLNNLFRKGSTASKYPNNNKSIDLGSEPAGEKLMFYSSCTGPVYGSSLYNFCDSDVTFSDLVLGARTNLSINQITTLKTEKESAPSTVSQPIPKTKDHNDIHTDTLKKFAVKNNFEKKFFIETEESSIHNATSPESNSVKDSGIDSHDEKTNLKPTPLGRKRTDNSNTNIQTHKDHDHLFWLNIKNPTFEEMDIISKVFHIHPLTVEDILSPEIAHEKVDTFGDYVFITYSAIDYYSSQNPNSESKVNYTNIQSTPYFIIVKNSCVLSFHTDGHDDHIDDTLIRLNNLTSSGHDYMLTPSYITYAIIDLITDEIGPTARLTELEVDAIDELVLILSSKEHNDILLRLGTTRRRILSLFRLIQGKPSVVKSVSREINKKIKNSEDQLAQAINRLNSRNLVLKQEHSNSPRVRPRIISSSHIRPDADPLEALNDGSTTEQNENVSINQLNEEIVALRKTIHSLNEVLWSYNDVGDHINYLVSVCSQSELILARTHTNYMGKLSLELASASEDIGVLANNLTIIGVISTPFMIVGGLFGMNVKVPWQGDTHDTLAAFYSIVAFCSKISLKIKAELENVTDLRPSSNQFEWHFKLSRGDAESCYVEHDGKFGMLGHGTNEIRMRLRCQVVEELRTMSVAIVEGPFAYKNEDSNKFSQIAVLDCRGIEPVEFNPQGEWEAFGVESGLKFDSIDMTDSEWVDYDEKDQSSSLQKISKRQLERGYQVPDSGIEGSDERPSKQMKETDDDYEEDDRFFMDGLTKTEKNVFDWVDQVDNIEQVGKDSAKRTILKLEKAISKNTELRLRYPNDPQKFIDSEADLDESILELQNLSTQVLDTFPIVLELGVIDSLVNLMTHENKDIVLDVIQVVGEWTAEDLFEENDTDESSSNVLLCQQVVQRIVEELKNQGYFQSLGSALRNMNENASSEIVESEREGVNKILNIIENVSSINTSLLAPICIDMKLVPFLLCRISKNFLDKSESKLSRVDSNQQYSAEILSILVQLEPKTISMVTEPLNNGSNGIDIILECMSKYRKMDPLDSTEFEYVESLFNILLSISLDSKDAKKKIVESEGIELLCLMLKEQNFARVLALKLIDFLITPIDVLGDDSLETEIVERVLSGDGYTYLCKALMKKNIKNLKKYPEFSTIQDQYRVTSILSWMFRLTKPNTKLRWILLSKFISNENSSIGVQTACKSRLDRLVEIHLFYSEAVQNQEDLVVEDALFGLYLIDMVLVLIAINDEFARNHIKKQSTSISRS